MIFQTAGFIYRNCIVKEIISDFNFMLKKLDPRGSGVKGSAEGALAPPLFDMKTLQDIDITGEIDNLINNQYLYCNIFNYKLITIQNQF